MSDLARQHIRENIEAHARGEDATFLDLSDCNMTEVPEEIGECNWVEVLLLQGNIKLADLSPLANLTALQKLSWYSTQVMDLSPLINLMALQFLDCHSTQVSDLSPLAGLLNVQQLRCYSTQVSDLSPLAGLLNLQLLNCCFTQVSDLSPLVRLVNLRQIRCDSTLVSDLSPLTGVLNLHHLTCNLTHVSNLSPLAGLPNLKHLNCAFTQVSDLSVILPLIEKGVPVKWRSSESGICIEGCPLIHPPIEIAQQGNAAILRYFEDLASQGEEIVYEAKMLILGDAGAGKTSLARKIEDPDAEMPHEEKDSTPGIAVRSLLLAGQPDFTMHIWDFGGQEVYHATHQFFLSKRSLYILLADGRKEEQLDYWLQMQEIYGQDSRLLLVVNQKAEMQPNLPMSDIRRDYPNVQEAQPTIINLKTDRAGAIALRQRIERSVRNLPQFEQGLRTPKMGRHPPPTRSPRSRPHRARRLPRPLRR